MIGRVMKRRARGFNERWNMRSEWEDGELQRCILYANKKISIMFNL